MTRDAILDSFVSLGQHLSSQEPHFPDPVIKEAVKANPWFTPNTINHAANAIIYMLQEDHLQTWLNKYHYSTLPSTIGIVMAGNIPLVGFHDFLCVGISGHKAMIKPSRQDDVLIRWIAKWLIKKNEGLSERIEFVERLKGMDAIIATGSNNTSRYFEYYFRDIPHVIRKNRSSLAVLHGNEPRESLQLLGKDIFMYYGLGCRNISLILMPEAFPISSLLNALEEYSNVSDHSKYKNNYDYNKSIFLVNSIPHFDSGFLLMTESDQTNSPLAVLHYLKYKDQSEISDFIQRHRQNIQCISTENAWLENSISFGNCQQPGPDDYADGVDTMKFLEEINQSPLNLSC